MFQTGKPMAPFLIETLARTIPWEVCLAEVLQGAKTALKFLEIDISKQENKVSNSKIGIEFSLKYNMQQVKSSGKITSVQEKNFKADVCTFPIAMGKHMTGKIPLSSLMVSLPYMSVTSVHD